MFDRLRTRLDAGRQDGFTLIELLIVIVILGILAGIVVFAVGNARSDSVTNSCKADVKTVNTALEAYKAKNGGYPADAGNATTDVTTTQSAPLTGTANGGPFLKTYPTSSDYRVFWASGTASGVKTTTGNPAC